MQEEQKVAGVATLRSTELTRYQHPSEEEDIMDRREPLFWRKTSVHSVCPVLVRGSYLLGEKEDVTVESGRLDW